MFITSRNMLGYTTYVYLETFGENFLWRWEGAETGNRTFKHYQQYNISSNQSFSISGFVFFLDMNCMSDITQTLYR